jgi:hypothetical protein
MEVSDITDGDTVEVHYKSEAGRRTERRSMEATVLDATGSLAKLNPDVDTDVILMLDLPEGELGTLFARDVDTGEDALYGSRVRIDDPAS